MTFNLSPLAASQLNQDLRAAGYRADELSKLLNINPADLDRDNPNWRLAVETEPGSSAFQLLGFFIHGKSLTLSAWKSLLPHVDPQELLTAGLVAERDGKFYALVEIRPFYFSQQEFECDFLIASDLRELATGHPLNSEHVMGVGGATRTLLAVTNRRRIDTAADIGTGCGIQALALLKHAKRVVATDISARALAFTQLNAALNFAEVDRLDLRIGSLTEPLRDEQFDLVVSNPPFVITPRGLEQETFTYRDAGLAGDQVLADLVSALPAHLCTGGQAVLLGNWEISTTADDFAIGPRGWLKNLPLHAWLVQREELTIHDYAAQWIRDGGVLPREDTYIELMRAWLADFASRDTATVGLGFLLLEKTNALPQQYFEYVSSGSSKQFAATLWDAFARQIALAEMPDENLLTQHLCHAPDVIEKRYLSPGLPDPLIIELTQGAGFARTKQVSAEVAALVGACDGELSIEQILTALSALMEVDLAELSTTALMDVRELVRTGFLDLLDEN